MRHAPARADAVEHAVRDDGRNDEHDERPDHEHPAVVQLRVVLRGQDGGRHQGDRGRQEPQRKSRSGVRDVHRASSSVSAWSATITTRDHRSSGADDWKISDTRMTPQQHRVAVAGLEAPDQRRFTEREESAKKPDRSRLATGSVERTAGASLERPPGGLRAGSPPHHFHDRPPRHSPARRRSPRSPCRRRPGRSRSACRTTAHSSRRRRPSGRRRSTTPTAWASPTCASRWCGRASATTASRPTTTPSTRRASGA